jgi:hypothetical protein
MIERAFGSPSETVCREPVVAGCRASGKEIDTSSDTEFLGAAIGEPSRREVLKCKANAPENSHLLIIASSRSGSGQYLAEFGIDGVCGEVGTPDSPHRDGERPVVHHDTGNGQRIRRDLTLAGLVGAERRDVQSRPQVPAEQERLLGPGRRNYDLGTFEGSIEIAGQSDIESLARRIGREPFGRFRHRIENANRRQSSYATESPSCACPCAPAPMIATVLASRRASKSAPNAPTSPVRNAVK